MTAYAIAQIKIEDSQEYQKYLAGFMPIFERHKGKLLVTSNCESEVVEGSWALPSTVVMQFPDLAAAQAWKNDPDYQALAEHRWRSAQTNLIIVEGIE